MHIDENVCKATCPTNLKWGYSERKPERRRASRSIGLLLTLPRHTLPFIPIWRMQLMTGHIAIPLVRCRYGVMNPTTSNGQNRNGETI